jgi:hypothetical protein
VPRAGLSSDLYAYFTDTIPEAKILAEQLEQLNSYIVEEKRLMDSKIKSSQQRIVEIDYNNLDFLNVKM